ncbi:hypothetical protein D3C71_702070 [compost metagenome]
MHRNPNSSGLVRNRTRNRLTDPPCRIRTEFEALLKVELLHRFDETHISFLNQVQEQHSTSYITFGYTYHETKISFSQPAFGFFIAFLNPLGELDFIITGQEGNTSYFLQIHPNRVIDFDTRRQGEIIIKVEIILVLTFTLIIARTGNKLLITFIGYINSEVT